VDRAAIGPATNPGLDPGAMRFRAWDCLAGEPITEPGPQVIAKMAAEKRGGAANCFYVFPETQEEEATRRAIEPARKEVETGPAIAGQRELF